MRYPENILIEEDTDPVRAIVLGERGIKPLVQPDRRAGRPNKK